MIGRDLYVFALIGYSISLATIPFILMSQKRPAGTLAWLWAVILFPYLAPLAYLCFGSEQIYRKRLLRRHRHQRARKGTPPGPSLIVPPLEDAEMSQQLSKINLYPATAYTEAKLLLDAHEFYPALEKAIAEARDTINFEVFIWRNDTYGKRFLDLLTAAAERGVRVRLVLDEVGCYYLFKNYFDPLVAAGGQFSWFNALHPLHNRWAFSLRNHRKLQIIDGKMAFIGGMNIGHEYMGENPAFGRWRDVQMKVTGAVVATLTRTFEDDWYFATGESLARSEESADIELDSTKPAHVIEEGPDSTKYPLVLSMVTMLNSAKKRIWLTAGYFFPQEPLLTALKLCAARGVDVRILVGIKNEHPYIVKGARFYYEELLTYGVRIFEYDHGVHHAKIVLLDETWASVGSANLDVRSMRLNFELNVVLHSPEVAAALHSFLQDDFDRSTEMDLKTFSSRSPWTRSIENLCRIIGPLA